MAPDTLLSSNSLAVLRSIKLLLVDVGLFWTGLVLPRPTVKSIAIAWRFIKKSTQGNPE